MTTWAFNPFTGNLDQVGAGSPATPGGSDTQIQFNDGGSFAGSSTVTYNKTSGVLTVSGVNSNAVLIQAQAATSYLFGAL